MTRAMKGDFESIKILLETLDEKKNILEEVQEATVNPDSSNLSFVAKIDDEIVGVFVLAKDVNLEYYKSHFHI